MKKRRKSLVGWTPGNSWSLYINNDEIRHTLILPYKPKTTNLILKKVRITLEEL